jgi:alpha-1,3-rhamnosyl/mannosyltransferase
LCPRKNIGAALRAFELGRQLEPELQLVLVGEIDFGWEQSPPARALKRLRLEAPERVVQTGYLPRDLLWDAYAHARAVLFLSHYEGFGLPVVESQWVGTPVIASRRGGIPDASGGHAWLVDPESDEDLSAAVGAVLNGGDAVEARRLAGRAHARSFSAERAAASVEALHNEVLGH